MVRLKVAGMICVVIGFIVCADAVPARAQDKLAVPCFEELILKNSCELEQIYRQAKPGTFPVGFARGHVIYRQNEPLAHSKERVTALLWHGKHFSADGTLINQWAGVRAIRAKVHFGESWLDGQQSIILDYSDTSLLWSDVRDEMREVAPGLYVGAMYRGRCQQLKLYFVLQTTGCCN